MFFVFFFVMAMLVLVWLLLFINFVSYPRVLDWAAITYLNRLLCC